MTDEYGAVEIPASVYDAFDHLYLWGLAAIIESETDSIVTLRWKNRTTAELSTGTGGAPRIAALAEVVLQHARRHASSPWLTTTKSFLFSKDPKKAATRSPLSPRIGALRDAHDFTILERARQELLDTLSSTDWLTWQFLGALGRPSHWSFNERNELLPDNGASAWEMKTRNRGEEFIQNRLAGLGAAVSRRSVDGVAAGLSGTTTIDEVGSDGLDSRTPTGLRAPSPADNARAWCALWGISQFPTQPVTGNREANRLRSVTAGAIRPEKSLPRFVLPVPERIPKTLASLRAIVRSTALADYALTFLSRRDVSPSFGAVSHDVEWLQQHHIDSLVLFTMAKSDNANAPEMHVEAGVVHRIALPATPFRSPLSERGYTFSRRGTGSRAGQFRGSGVI